MKFKPGMEFEHEGVHYRVVSGVNAEGDMILQFRVAGWHQPRIAHTLILASFKFQVEENNYPRPKYRGGYKLLDAIKEACRYGWEGVADRVKLERKNKND